MLYAVRDACGRITSLHRHDPGVGEPLAHDHADVRRFLGGDGPTAPVPAAPAPEADGFGQLDADFIRVLEDVIDALTSRNLINVTDLPEVAQTKLFARRSFRERRPAGALELFRPGDLEPML